jgi:pimeloyl-ACP methyl ester carboxylesterase
MSLSKKTLLSTVATFAAAVLALSTATDSSAQTPDDQHAGKPTIVLVHGAWADGSSWSAVTTRLQSAGYAVDVEANPLRGVASDAQYLKDHLAAITGPIVLVAHSYGGMVTTAAATGNANVKALVYVDACVPQQGDSVVSLTGAQPGSTLNPATSVRPVPLHDQSGAVIGADIYIKPDQFAAIFAAGLPATVLGAEQRPLSAGALTEKFTAVPAWQTIRSWDLIGTADKLLPPAEQLIMARRANAQVVQVNAPHLSMLAQPDAVTALIESAAGERG